MRRLERIGNGAWWRAELSRDGAGNPMSGSAPAVAATPCALTARAEPRAPEIPAQTPTAASTSTDDSGNIG